jgi:hypothetical protein
MNHHPHGIIGSSCELHCIYLESFYLFFQVLSILCATFKGLFKLGQMGSSMGKSEFSLTQLGEMAMENVGQDSWPVFFPPRLNPPDQAATGNPGNITKRP